MPDDVGIVALPQRPVLVPVRLDIEQREGAEHAGHVGRGSLMQIGRVEFTEAGDAEQLFGGAGVLLRGGQRDERAEGGGVIRHGGRQRGRG